MYIKANTMKRSFQIISICFLLSNCSPKEYPLGNFQSSPVVADGSISDWSLPLRFGTEDGSMEYNITNDNQNIYISVATNNQATQMRILRAGINIYIDTKGKSDKSMGVLFPVRADNLNNNYAPNPAAKEDNQNFTRGNNRRNNLTGETGPTAANQKKKLLMDNNIFKTFGFINMENNIYDLFDSTAIKMGVNYDQLNNLVIECVIPIKNITNKNFTASNAPSISVGIVLNNINMNRGATAMGAGGRTGGMEGGGGIGGGRGGMGGGMGGGMRGGGGMGGGRGGGGMRGGAGMGGQSMGGDRLGLNKEVANWYKFKLAYK